MRLLRWLCKEEFTAGKHSTPMDDIVFYYLVKLVPGSFIKVSRYTQQMAIDILMARQFSHPCREMWDTLKILDSVSSSLTRKFVGMLNAQQRLIDPEYGLSIDEFLYAMTLLESMVPCFLNASKIGSVMRISFTNMAFCSSIQITPEMARVTVRAMLIHFPEVVMDYLHGWYYDNWVMNSRHKTLTTTLIDVILAEYESLIDDTPFSRIHFLIEEYDETVRTFEQDLTCPWDPL